MSAASKPTKSEPGAVATGSKTRLQIEKQIEETQLPNSRRIYIDGKQAGVRVAFREVDQNATRNFDGSLEENPPVRIYDTSGPYGDPSIRCDVREGLSALRREWIVGRGDVEEYEGRDLQPIDDGYLTFDAANQARQKESPGPKSLRGLSRAEPHASVREEGFVRDPDALRQERHHHAGDGIHRDSGKPGPGAYGKLKFVEPRPRFT